jgi:hypothetical protein
MLIDLEVSPLFPDMIQCMAIQVLEIKKSKSYQGISFTAERLTGLSTSPVSGLSVLDQLRPFEVG